MNFVFSENEIKVCSKFYKKKLFHNLESLCDDMQNGRISQNLLKFLNTFNGAF